MAKLSINIVFIRVCVCLPILAKLSFNCFMFAIWQSCESLVFTGKNGMFAIISMGI